ncbi:MAG: hypothetical protein N2167_02185 [Flavobacteriales bacterium]|nr:hypothetical protein [Flavobacteriales bacterium]
MLKQIKKIIKVTGIGFLISIALLFISMILLQFVFYHQVSGRLKQIIEGNEDISIQVGSLNFNLFKGNIALTQVIVHDTSGFFYVACDSMLIKGINPIPLIFNNTLSIHKLLLSNGSIEVNTNKKSFNIEKRKSSWIVHKTFIKNFDVKINHPQVAVRLKLGAFQTEKVNSRSTKFLPFSVADATISNILLSREENFFSLDSIHIHLKDDLSSIQLKNFNVLALSKVLKKSYDTVVSPVNEFIIDKIQIGIPVYYFKYADLNKIPSIEIPFLHVNGLLVNLQKYTEAFKTKSSVVFNSFPFDFNVKELMIHNGRLKVLHDSIIQFDFLLKYLKARNLRTDATYKIYPLIADAVDVSLNDIYFGFKDQMHQINIHKLNYASGQNRFQADKINIGSSLETEEYFKLKKFQTDMPSFALGTMVLDGLNISALLNNNQFVFRKVWADTLELKMTRDKNYPYDLKNFPPMIQDQILQLPFIFSVDTVSVQHGEITYYEIPQGATLDDAGMFQFTSASLNMYQCTNDTNRLHHNDTLMIHFRGKLYGQGVLNVFVDIPLLSKSYWHRVYGTIGKFNAREFNRITVPAVGVKLKGTVNGGEFYFEANNEFSTGNVELLFEKLKVSVLTQTGSAAKSQTDILKSLVANVFMVHDNPEPGKEVMVGKIYYKRNVNRWMINFWWKSLLQGVRSIVFAKEVQLREMSASFNEYKKLRKQREEMDQLMQE